MEDVLHGINEILSLKYPPKVQKYPYCNKCSYYEYCYIKEEE